MEAKTEKTELAPDPNENPASDAAGTVAASGDDAGSTTDAPSQNSVANGGATPSDPSTAEINPSNALAGTSGKLAGTNNTGMAAGATPPKAESTQPAGDGTQLGLPGIPADTANVNVAVTAPHPIAHKTHSLVAELETILSNVEKSPAILRAEKLIKEAQEWIVQHFEDVKRKQQ